MNQSVQQPSKAPSHEKSRTATYSSERMPALFLAHGSPMNAISDNRWSRSYIALKEELPRKPKAIIVISAHWYGDGLFVTAEAEPHTNHDFYGFPERLHQLKYPAPGSPELGQALVQPLHSFGAKLRSGWGLDHGCWGVLTHLFPDADIPVIQLSLDRLMSPETHIAVGKALIPLRDQGILIIGSGNITHNLRHALQAAPSAKPPHWALAFDEATAAALKARDILALSALINSQDGRQAHPSPEHWYPVLSIFGTSSPEDELSFPIEGFDANSISMRSFIYRS